LLSPPTLPMIPLSCLAFGEIPPVPLRWSWLS
jgi:hypothetical protein